MRNNFPGWELNSTIRKLKRRSKNAWGRWRDGCWTLKVREGDGVRKNRDGTAMVTAQNRYLHCIGFHIFLYFFARKIYHFIKFGVKINAIYEKSLQKIKRPFLKNPFPSLSVFRISLDKVTVLGRNLDFRLF